MNQYKRNGEFGSIHSLKVPRYVPCFQELNKDFVLLHPFQESHHSVLYPTNTHPVFTERSILTMNFCYLKFTNQASYRRIYSKEFWRRFLGNWRLLIVNFRTLAVGSNKATPSWATWNFGTSFPCPRLLQNTATRPFSNSKKKWKFMGTVLHTRRCRTPGITMEKAGSWQPVSRAGIPFKTRLICFILMQWARTPFGRSRGFLEWLREDTFRRWRRAHEKGVGHHADASDEANADRCRCVY